MDDLISRKAAVNTVFSMCCRWNTDDPNDLKNMLLVAFQDLPSAEPEIIWCKDCMHNGSYDTDCPIDWNGKEYCNFAERRILNMLC